jgi:hypothetical protein
MWTLKKACFVVAIIALLGGLIASLYIIHIAPALMVEILVDGVLVVGLYKRVRHIGTAKLVASRGSLENLCTDK